MSIILPFWHTFLREKKLMCTRSEILHNPHWPSCHLSKLWMTFLTVNQWFKNTWFFTTRGKCSLLQNPGYGVRPAWVTIPFPPLSCYVILGKFSNFSGLCNSTSSINADKKMHSIEFWWGLGQWVQTTYQVRFAPDKNNQRMGKCRWNHKHSGRWYSVCKPLHTGSQAGKRPPQRVYELEHLLGVRERGSERDTPHH